MLTEEKLYTVPEVAEYTGQSEWTIRHYRKVGKLMRTKVGGSVRIRESELRKLIVDEPEQPTGKAK